MADLVGGLAVFADSLASVVQIMLIVNSALLLATELEAGLLSSRRPRDDAVPA